MVPASAISVGSWEVLSRVPGLERSKGPQSEVWAWDKVGEAKIQAYQVQNIQGWGKGEMM